MLYFFCCGVESEVGYTGPERTGEHPFLRTDPARATGTDGGGDVSLCRHSAAGVGWSSLKERKTQAALSSRQL